MKACYYSLKELYLTSDTIHIIYVFTFQIGGLQLEGCSFQGDRLVENQLDSPSVTAMPTCTVAWVTKDIPPPYPEAQRISLPIYTPAVIVTNWLLVWTYLVEGVTYSGCSCVVQHCFSRTSNCPITLCMHKH